MSEPQGTAFGDLRTVAVGDFNVDPAVWGPPLWSSVHTLALKADSDGPEGLVPFKEFLNSLTFLLPCNNCRHEFNKYYSVHGAPEPMDCFGWTVRLHNFVSQRLGKTSAQMSESEARAMWTSKACNYKCSAGAEPVGGQPRANEAPQLASLLAATLAGAVFVAILYEYKGRQKNAER